MDDTGAMRSGEHIGDPAPEFNYFFRAHARGGNDTVQCLALQVLHHDAWLTLVFQNVVNRDDSGMIQRRSSLRFKNEAVTEFQVHRREELDSDHTAESLVAGLPDSAHSAFADPFEDAVLRDAHARQILLSFATNRE
jgi:hypothetical protein